MESSEEGEFLDYAPFQPPVQRVLRSSLLHQPSAVDVQCREADRLAEFAPLAGKVHDFALADERFENEDGVAARHEHLVELLQDGAGS